MIMGNMSRLLISFFIIIGERGGGIGDFSKQPDYGMFNGGIVLQAVVEVNEGHVDCHVFRKLQVVPVKTVCFAYAPAHFYTVYGMSEPFFGY